MFLMICKSSAVLVLFAVIVSIRTDESINENIIIKLVAGSETNTFYWPSSAKLVPMNSKELRSHGLWDESECKKILESFFKKPFLFCNYTNPFNDSTQVLSKRQFLKPNIISRKMIQTSQHYQIINNTSPFDVTTTVSTKVIIRDMIDVTGRYNQELGINTGAQVEVKVPIFDMAAGGSIDAHLIHSWGGEESELFERVKEIGPNLVVTMKPNSSISVGYVMEENEVRIEIQMLVSASGWLCGTLYNEQSFVCMPISEDTQIVKDVVRVLYSSNSIINIK